MQTAGRPPPPSCLGCGSRASWVVCLVTAMVSGDDFLVGSCPWCGTVFAICRPCYRGHRYCGPACSLAARTQSVERARRRHRQSPEGRADHRDRERDRRRRRQAGRVEDQGSPIIADTASLTVPEPAPVVAALPEPEAARVTPTHSRPCLHCILCRRPARLLRTSPWPRRCSSSPRRWQIAPRAPS